jgi:hypothetical protein
MKIFIFARFHARVGQESSVEAVLRDVAGPTREEPGCLSYHVFRSTRDPLLFYVHPRGRTRRPLTFTQACHIRCGFSNKLGR